MKNILLILAIAFVALAASEISAQKKQRIGLPEGADSVSVKGKISGRQYALYEIWAEKGDVWEINLSSPNEYIGYTVKSANGDRYDFLEPAPVSGFYTIRVELNSTGAKRKKPADFTLDIKFEMVPGKPFSD